ncbi:hypothetical protein A5892_04490 [Halotalea alkalilenta]|uniref:Uncharacterized protein n=2 Tax=Halotalea alkalilenta TaxID=376489 RepID=A0A172YCH4_9GAMM|nr:hypothetical protein A5892_04490 [Halotalea alkalilenta]
MRPARWLSIESALWCDKNISVGYSFICFYLTAQKMQELAALLKVREAQPWLRGVGLSTKSRGQFHSARLIETRVPSSPLIRRGASNLDAVLQQAKTNAWCTTARDQRSVELHLILGAHRIEALEKALAWIACPGVSDG